MCVENPSPSWNESHVDFNKNDSLSTVFLGDGFARTAGFEGPINDVIGARVMGYYTGDNLNYYYFMASNFAMGDDFHSPMPGNTTPNRMFIHAATSQGFAHKPTRQLTSKTTNVTSMEDSQPLPSTSNKNAQRCRRFQPKRLIPVCTFAPALMPKPE